MSDQPPPPPPEWGQPSPWPSTPPPPYQPNDQAGSQTGSQPPQWSPAPQYGQQGFGPQGYGPPRNEGAAIAAMVTGIVGVVFCGIVLGVVALVLGITSRGKIQKSNGQLTGGGMALAGIILGAFDIVAGIAFIALFSGGAFIR